jgi:hypothetical protein
MPQSFPLNPPLDKKVASQLMNQRWGYDEILAAAPPPVVVSLPPVIMTAVTMIASRQQGDRGTCVGQSTVYLLDLIHFMLTGQLPKGEIVRDIVEGGKAIHDALFDISYSAQCAYELSRKEGGITDPSGSYVNASVKSIFKNGCCLESSWWTSKTAKYVWQTPYPKSQVECDAEATQHKTEGYAALKTVTEIKQAIFAHGACIGAINIYENYMQGKVTENGVGLYDGNLPDPSGECVGSHALCFFGYNDNERRLYFLHSWEGWTFKGSISYAYWDIAGGDFWVVLDTSEAIIGMDINMKVDITSNVPAEIFVDGQSYGITPCHAHVLIGQHKVKAIATGYKTKEIALNVDESTTAIAIVLETEQNPNNFWVALVTMLKSLFSLWRK